MNIMEIILTKEMEEQALSIREKCLKIINEKDPLLLKEDPEEMRFILSTALEEQLSKEVSVKDLKALQCTYLPMQTAEMNYPLYIPFPNLPILMNWYMKEDLLGCSQMLRMHLDQMCLYKPMTIIEMTLNGKLQNYIKTKEKKIQNLLNKIQSDLKEKNSYYELNDQPQKQYEILNQCIETAKESVLHMEVNLQEALTVDTEERMIQNLMMCYLIHNKPIEMLQKAIDFIQELPILNQKNPMETAKQLLMLDRKMNLNQVDYLIPQMIAPLFHPTEEIINNLLATVEHRTYLSTLMSILNPQLLSLEPTILK